jgi:16S rRNA (guanine1516-N2)-methyltransferase
VTVAVTTSGQGGDALEAKARAASAEWGLPYLPRARKQPLERLFEAAAVLLIFEKTGLALRDREGGLRWSPGMAALRMAGIDRGRTDDTLVRVAELREADHVLDCTAGLAQDALVAARAVGPRGRVCALEKSLPLYALTSTGLAAHHPGPSSARIELRRADAAEALLSWPAQDVDVVLFDPMFERTRPASGTFEAMRRFADYGPLTRTMLDQAQRVARRAVIVKGARYSRDLAKLGLTPLPTSRFATVLWARLGARSP